MVGLLGPMQGLLQGWEWRDGSRDGGLSGAGSVSRINPRS